MPKLVKDVEDTTLQGFRPYHFHGIELPNWKPGDANGYGDCVLCGGDSKFSVKAETGQYRCWKCGESGSPIEFFRQLWTLSDDGTKDYRELMSNRKLLNIDTLHHWGVARSIASRDWIIPGFNPAGAIVQLYRYLRTRDKHTGKERMTLLPTPTLNPGHAIFGRQLYDDSRPKVYLCEGPWDAMALWEILGQAKESDRGLVSTGSDIASLRAEASVLAVPTCTVFFGSWLGLFSGKIVVLMFDSDHPRTHPDTGALSDPAGFAGMQRIARIMRRAKEPPAEIHYLNWGEGGYDATLPSGTDVRDILCA